MMKLRTVRKAVWGLNPFGDCMILNIASLNSNPMIPVNHETLPYISEMRSKLDKKGRAGVTLLYDIEGASSASDLRMPNSVYAQGRLIEVKFGALLYTNLIKWS